jgi:hypothetical protein
MSASAVAQGIVVDDRPLNADYALIDAWRQTPSNVHYEFVTDVAVGPDDRVYALTRKPGLILVYEPDGTFVQGFGSEHLGVDPHGLTVAGDRIYVADQFNHVVHVFTIDGRHCGMLGTFGRPSDTGVDDTLKDVFVRAASIRHSGPPFNRPTAVAVATNGNLYVSDGYNNSRIHQFSADGALIRSWGEPGPLAGQFWIAHHLAITADQRVLVVDRGNERIQVFSADGAFLDEWRGLQHPAVAIPQSDGTVLVGELSWKTGAGSFARGRIIEPMPARISLFSADGKRLRQSVDEYGGSKFHIRSPHGMAVDSHGAIYVADLRVARTEEPGHQMVQKFPRLRPGAATG